MFRSLFDAACDLTDSALNVGVGVITLGQFGTLNSEQIGKLLASGYTIYELSELTGVAVELIQEVLNDES
jgi:hypothetical protein